MTSTQPHRILVVSNETAEGDTLYRTIGDRARTSDVRVFVVAPALNSRLRHWTSDCDSAREAAASRLRSCLDRLTKAGVDANGRVGDADPLQAIADSLSLFDAQELIIVTHPEERSNWLARDVVERAQRRFDLPTTHLIVDRARELEFAA